MKSHVVTYVMGAPMVALIECDEFVSTGDFVEFYKLLEETELHPDDGLSVRNKRELVCAFNKNVVISVDLQEASVNEVRDKFREKRLHQGGIVTDIGRQP